MQKNLQYLGLTIPDIKHFGAWNAKFSLHLAFAIPSIDALRIIPQMPRSFIKAKWVGTLMRDSPTLTYFINYHYSTNATFLCKIQQRLKPKTNLLDSWLHVDNSLFQSHRFSFFFLGHILRSIFFFTQFLFIGRKVFFFFFNLITWWFRILPFTCIFNYMIYLIFIIKKN